MLDMICPFPWEESVPSFSTIIVGVCPPKDMALFAAQAVNRKIFEVDKTLGLTNARSATAVQTTFAKPSQKSMLQALTKMFCTRKIKN